MWTEGIFHFLVVVISAKAMAQTFGLGCEGQQKALAEEKLSPEW